jgi:hypothetical protein
MATLEKFLTGDFVNLAILLEAIFHKESKFLSFTQMLYSKKKGNKNANHASH